MNNLDSKPLPLPVIYFAIFFCAWLVRLVFLVHMSDHPSFQMPLVDAGEYHDLAAKIATGRGNLDKISWQPWFYPVVLSWVYAIFGVSVWVAKLVQITVGSLTCMVVTALGVQMGLRRLGIVAGLMASFYGPMIFQDGELLAETWAGLWLALTAFVAMRAMAKPKLAHFCALGALGALCLFTRPPLVPAWGLAMVVCLMHTGKKFSVSRSIGGLMIGCSLAAWPFLHAVQTVTGKMSLLPSTGGINFYIGNSADPCRTINIRPGYQWEILTQWPMVEGARTAAEQDTFFYQQAFNDIRANPVQWLKHLGVKAAQFVSSREIPRNLDIYSLREESGLLSAMVWKWESFGFPFGAMAGFYLLGFFPMAAKNRGGENAACLMLVLMTLAYAAGIIAIHVCDRYRIPVIPLMLPVAAGGALILWDHVRQKRLVATIGSLAVILIAGVLTSAAGLFCVERLNYRAELDRIIATYAYEARNIPLSETYARSAINKNPAEANAWNQLGLIHAVRGQIEEAAKHFEKAITNDPAMATAWFNLAKVALNRKQPELAIRHYETGLAIMPGHLDARLDLGDLLLKQGEVDRAMAAYQEVLRMKPDYAPAVQRMERTRRNPTPRSVTEGSWPSR